MIVLNFSFNNDTYNTEIDLLEQIDLSRVELNIEIFVGEVNSPTCRTKH